MADRIRSFRDLEVYQLALAAAMEIFILTKTFPLDERYSLIDQIRRSSRSICANIAEAWRKRRYIAAFRSKLSDAMQEAAETQTWLDFALACQYCDEETYTELDRKYEMILSKLNTMDMKAETFCFTADR